MCQCDFGCMCIVHSSVVPSCTVLCSLYSISLGASTFFPMILIKITFIGIISHPVTHILHINTCFVRWNVVIRLCFIYWSLWAGHHMPNALYNGICTHAQWWHSQGGDVTHITELNQITCWWRQGTTLSFKLDEWKLTEPSSHAWRCLI